MFISIFYLNSVFIFLPQTNGHGAPSGTYPRRGAVSSYIF